MHGAKCLATLAGVALRRLPWCTCVSASARQSRAQCKERKKENRQPKGGMGGRHAATTQGFVRGSAVVKFLPALHWLRSRRRSSALSWASPAVLLLPQPCRRSVAPTALSVHTAAASCARRPLSTLALHVAATAARSRDTLAGGAPPSAAHAPLERTAPRRRRLGLRLPARRSTRRSRSPRCGDAPGVRGIIIIGSTPATSDRRLTPAPPFPPIH